MARTTSFTVQQLYRLTVLFAGSAIAVLPPYIVACKKNEPKFNECIFNTIEGLREKLIPGIPELEVPPLEPFELKNIRLLRGPVGARLDVNLTNIEVKGPSSFKVHNLKSNLKDNTFTFKLTFDELSFKGKYQMDATVLLLRLSGKGDISGNFTGYSSDVILRGEKVLREGVEYLNFERMKLNIKIGVAKVHLTDLFGGDPVLGTATNEVLNANSALFLEEIKPVLESSLADLFTEIANKITRSFTYKELFPDK
ncbi:circadian clock-controlled protein daywake-like isoform X3 [Athalia rosae]|uniref:circadian clock-controlled protein daywake-like isoform X3 n=1 Tax=Athalia rosae TaxID=37344 RepID=UPI0020349EB2|nr:circadian clock-controlled protein daywake-like isoform X3 [Athalia rosae]